MRCPTIAQGAAALALLLCPSLAAAEEPVTTPPAAKPLAGFHDGFFVRDRQDIFRLYFRGRFNLDAYGFAGPGVAALSAPDGGTALVPRVFARRLRLELGGDFFGRAVSFYASVDFGGMPLANANGKTEQSAAKAGDDPTAATARYAPIQSVSASAAPADVWMNLRGGDALNLMIGQYQAPFSLENRTSEGFTPFMERNLAIRAFVFPTGKETGVTAWGTLGAGVFDYEVGVFGGDGLNRPQVDRRFDFVGRAFTRPLKRGHGLFAGAQLGVSARYGMRDPSAVGYDYPQMTTAQGFVLWDASYKDSAARTMHILPSGPQRALGGELRLPVGRFDLRTEAYYVANGTREAVDGLQLTTTERLGLMRGVGWYVQLSAWPLGDAFVYGDPGFTRPRHPAIDGPPEPIRKGLEVLAMVSGVNAHYAGASRGGAADAKTPDGDITIYQYAFGANYWLTRFFRATIDYSVYHTPGSGSADNLAGVPGNLGKTPVPGAHVLHEMGARVGIQL
jgi:hypothetical protein